MSFGALRAASAAGGPWIDPISGNHFFGCGQCINLAFTDNRSRGQGIVIERNIFRGTARMPVEVGPIGAYTENLIVRDNWAADFRNRGPDPGDTMSTFVAYRSEEHTSELQSLMRNSYAVFCLKKKTT